MTTIVVNWRDIYRHIINTEDALYLYTSLDKKYYSIDRNFHFYSHRVTKENKIRKVLDINLSNVSEDTFYSFMMERFQNIQLILSPISQLKMCISEVEAIQLADGIQKQLRSLLVNVIGEQNFRKGIKEFTSNGLRSTFDVEGGLLLNSLTCWMLEKDNNDNTPSLNEIFYLYDSLYHENLVCELLKSIFISRNN